MNKNSKCNQIQMLQIHSLRNQLKYLVDTKQRYVSIELQTKIMIFKQNIISVVPGRQILSFSRGFLLKKVPTTCFIKAATLVGLFLRPLCTCILPLRQSTYSH